MTESRQQRRARERAEQKAASGLGPNPRFVHTEPPNRPVTINARVVWSDDPDYAPEAIWHATWEEVEPEPAPLPNGRDINDLVQVTSYMDGDDLELLVAEVLGAIAQEWPNDDLTVSWSLDADAREEANKLGVTFPTRRLKPV
ncbi:hypothetical protein [Nocardia iowensis]|uniref:Uncharacterized protein n=1 Tax=Nocardia iowensis TaxID=204891 RepID=A0ABX8RPN2_NOCIO|nr:hypothetical protein [Nocardia iowensis]QXN90245.1 hypothetical protein KV110_33265 [Nocardia iowensis]